MAKLAIPAGRNRSSEENIGGNHEYVQLSLKGKWIALARTWLKRNCPCLLEQYFYEVTPLMPTHISSFRSCSDAKMSAAKNALFRLSKPRKGEHCWVRINGQTLEYVPQAKPKGIYNFSERFPMKGVDVVEVSTIQFQSRKERDAFRMYLSRLGFVSTGRNVFTRKSE